MRGRQSANEARAIGLRASGGEVAADLAGQPGAATDRSDDMVLDGDRERRRPGTRELRVEGTDDSIGALRRKVRPGIEQAEVARVRHLDDAVLHPLDGPAQELVER